MLHSDCFFNASSAAIFFTPNMVALMEACALELAKAYLEEGETTVGAEIHCRHLAPTPVGMKVTATARLREIERRKMWFDIEVNDEKGKCGEGWHQLNEGTENSAPSSAFQIF